MIEKEPNQISTDIPHRRRGSAFDTLANVFRNVKELVFQNNVLMRNRPGESNEFDVENVLEVLANKPPAKGKLNFFYFGRRGIEDQNGDAKRYVNYQEMSSNADTSLPDSRGNGQARMNVSVNGNENTSGVAIFYGGVAQAGRTGIRASMIGEGDNSTADLGGAQIVYINTSNGSFKGIAVDKEGIQMVGLPTSPTGLEPNTIWNDGGTLKIV
jgi:hypothetical protein